MNVGGPNDTENVPVHVFTVGVQTFVDPQLAWSELSDAERRRLLESSYWSQEHLIALGRIVELTATGDGFLRQLLGRSMGLPETGYVSQSYIDAAFLGLRTGELAKRLQAISRIRDTPSWTKDAATWARDLAKAGQKRDELVHRSPVMIMNGPNGPAPGLGRGRLSQVFEIVDKQAVEALAQLVDLIGRGREILTESRPA